MLRKLSGKHLLRTQSVSEQNQKHFLCPGHKICVRNKCCARGQTGKHLCRQQCVRNNVSSSARALTTLCRYCEPGLRNLLVIRKKSGIISYGSGYLRENPDSQSPLSCNSESGKLGIMVNEDVFRVYRVLPVVIYCIFNRFYSCTVCQLLLISRFISGISNITVMV